MAFHRDLPEAQLHEPKGISLVAQALKAYLSDGAGSGSWEYVFPASFILVNSLSDLPSPVSSQITLADSTYYQLGTMVDIGANGLILGSNTCIEGLCPQMTGIVSSYAGTLFSATDVSFRLSHFRVSAPSATLFGVDQASFFAVSCDYITILSIGSLGTYNSTSGGIALFTNMNLYAAISSGLHFSGTWDALLVSQANVASVTADSFVDLGTATFQTILMRDILASLATGAKLLSGAVGSANLTATGRGYVDTAVTRGDGGDDPLSGITPEDARWEFSHCNLIQTTRPDGLLSMNGNTTNTVITAAATPALVAGTWTVQRASQMTGTAAGRLTYESTSEAPMPITASLTVQPASGTNQSIAAYIAINGVKIEHSSCVVNTDAGIPLNVVCVWQALISEDDYIEVFIENETSDIDILVSRAVLRVN